MEGIFSEGFDKRFRKLPVRVQRQFHERLRMFLANPTHPQLKNHVLRGPLSGFRAIAVTGDYRAIYHMVSRNTAEFVNIGTHNQVY